MTGEGGRENGCEKMRGVGGGAMERGIDQAPEGVE